MLKLFFQKCTRDWYSDQFQCRLALPINQPSLVSNIRAKPEPCNLQSLEIDQRIESSDGQSCKGRGDGPTHTHTHTQKTKNYRHQMRREKKRRPSPFAMRLGLGSSFYLFLLQKKKKNWRPPALPLIPLPCSKTTSCLYQWLLLLHFFLRLFPLSCSTLCSQFMKYTSRETETAVWPLPCSPLETSNVRHKHSLPEHKMCCWYMHWAFRFSLLIKHRHDNNCSTRAVLAPTSYTYKVVKPAQLESNTSTPSVTLPIDTASLLKNCKPNKHDSLKAEWEQSQQTLCAAWESVNQSVGWEQCASLGW